MTPRRWIAVGVAIAIVVAGGVVAVLLVVRDHNPCPLPEDVVGEVVSGVIADDENQGERDFQLYCHYRGTNTAYGNVGVSGAIVTVFRNDSAAEAAWKEVETSSGDAGECSQDVSQAGSTTYRCVTVRTDVAEVRGFGLSYVFGEESYCEVQLSVTAPAVFDDLEPDDQAKLDELGLGLAEELEDRVEDC